MATKPAASKTKAAPKTAANTASKPVPRKAPVTKPSKSAPASAPAKAEVMNEVVEIAAEAKVVAQMRVKDLIDRVAQTSDQNKKDVRAIVEATLVELGKSLDEGESMNLPPFGKIRIANQKGDASGQMLTLKLRRGGERKPGKNVGKQALAEVGEDS